jgi:hypothetical protein
MGPACIADVDLLLIPLAGEEEITGEPRRIRWDDLV